MSTTVLTKLVNDGFVLLPIRAGLKTPELPKGSNWPSNPETWLTPDAAVARLADKGNIGVGIPNSYPHLAIVDTDPLDAEAQNAHNLPKDHATTAVLQAIQKAGLSSALCWRTPRGGIALPVAGKAGESIPPVAEAEGVTPGLGTRTAGKFQTGPGSVVGLGAYKGKTPPDGEGPWRYSDPVDGPILSYAAVRALIEKPARPAAGKRQQTQNEARPGLVWPYTPEMIEHAVAEHIRPPGCGSEENIGKLCFAAYKTGIELEQMVEWVEHARKDGKAKDKVSRGYEAAKAKGLIFGSVDPGKTLGRRYPLRTGRSRNLPERGRRGQLAMGRRRSGMAPVRLGTLRACGRRTTP